MTINLGKFQKLAPPPTLINSADFQLKNRITLNNPKQTHFSVEGVQSYAPEQLKALKQRQDRTISDKQGTFVTLKTVLLSNEIIEGDQQPIQQQTIKGWKKSKKPEAVKNLQTEPEMKSALKQYIKKRSQNRINPRNAVSSNNQVMVRLEKQLVKKDAFERKLEKLSKKYKQHFKDVNLKQDIAVDEPNPSISQINRNGEEEPSEWSKESDDGFQEFIEEKQACSTKIATKKGKSNHQYAEQQHISQTDHIPKKTNMSNRKSSIPNSRNQVNRATIQNCSSYSQKLGTAIYSLFD